MRQRDKAIAEPSHLCDGDCTKLVSMPPSNVGSIATVSFPGSSCGHRCLVPAHCLRRRKLRLANPRAGTESGRAPRKPRTSQLHSLSSELWQGLLRASFGKWGGVAFLPLAGRTPRAQVKLKNGPVIDIGKTEFVSFQSSPHYPITEPALVPTNHVRPVRLRSNSFDSELFHFDQSSALQALTYTPIQATRGRQPGLRSLRPGLRAICNLRRRPPNRRRPQQTYFRR